MEPETVNLEELQPLELYTSEQRIQILKILIRAAELKVLSKRFISTYIKKILELL